MSIVIVGAGPAGMAAAVTAAESGAGVLVIDDNPSPGGQIWRGESGTRNPWFQRFHAAKLRTLFGARVVAAESHAKFLLVEDNTGSRQIPYGKLILATGSRELFLPFPGWTLPGVAGVGGLQALAKGGLPVARKRIGVAGSGPLLIAAAHYFRTHGAEVVLIAEQAPTRSLAGFGKELARHPAKMCQAAKFQIGLLGVPYWRSTWVEKAEGNGRLERLHFRSGSRRFTEEVHFAAIAYGLYPNNELALALGCAVDGARVLVDDLQQTSIDGIYCVGETTGIGGVDLSIVEGRIAGHAATGNSAAVQKLSSGRERERRFAAALNYAFALRPELKTLCAAETIVCRCEDVTFGALCAQSSFRAAKLHTRCGMGPCQGRICGAAADFLFGWRTESIRPPIFPARISTLTKSPEASTK